MAHPDRKFDWEIGREMERKDTEIARLKEMIASLAPFLAVWAVQYERDHNLNGLHPVHFDLLAATGARMDSFTRATNAQQIGRYP